jgi:hypothetical protein
MELIVPGVSLIIITVLALASIVLWIIALVDIVRNDFPGSNEKLIWILIVLFAPFIGSILYFAIGRKNRLKV